MTRTLMLACLLALFVPGGAVRGQNSEITSAYDAAKKQTTVRLATAPISGAQGKYHSLKFSLFYSYAGETSRVPEILTLQLLTVVKTRLLDPDLYVVFTVDGEEIFLSSNRSAVMKPVPGKNWIGERLDFRLPYETFLKFAGAKQITAKFDGVPFNFTGDNLRSIREFGRKIKELDQKAVSRSH